MGGSFLGKIIYIALILLMIASALWVAADCRKRGRQWDQTLAWGLFAGAFLGVGPIVYYLWNRRFP